MSSTCPTCSFCASAWKAARRSNTHPYCGECRKERRRLAAATFGQHTYRLEGKWFVRSPVAEQEAAR